MLDRVRSLAQFIKDKKERVTPTAAIMEALLAVRRTPAAGTHQALPSTTRG